MKPALRCKICGCDEMNACQVFDAETQTVRGCAWAYVPDEPARLTQGGISLSQFCECDACILKQGNLKIRGPLPVVVLSAMRKQGLIP